MDNRFDEILKEKSEKLKKCHQDKRVESCLNCEDMEKCQIREEYIKSVYQYMSKGESGGFSF